MRHGAVGRGRWVNIRVDPEVYAKVAKRAGFLQGQLERPVSMNEAVRDVLGLPEMEAGETALSELEPINGGAENGG